MVAKAVAVGVGVWGDFGLASESVAGVLMPFCWGCFVLGGKTRCWIRYLSLIKRG